MDILSLFQNVEYYHLTKYEFDIQDSDLVVVVITHIVS